MPHVLPSCAWLLPYAWALILLPLLAQCIYRCCVERRQPPAQPSPGVGWASHAAAVAAVHTSFLHFLSTRSPGQLLSLRRSREGHYASNRTMEATYKESSGTLDVSELDGVIALDAARGLVHVQPGLPQDELARFCLAHGILPPVVLEFPGITCGGAYSGGGIESTSHAAGSFADTVVELDVITGDGRYLQGVTVTGEHRALFNALRTSYGTHGLLTRLALRVHAAPPCVALSALVCDSPSTALLAMQLLTASPSPPPYLDALALSPTRAVVCVGRASTRAAAAAGGFLPLELRTARTSPWFAWLLADVGARRAPLTANDCASATAVAAACRAGPHAERWALSAEDYLFRFDRGAFWMARHGMQTLYGGCGYREPTATLSSGPSAPLRAYFAWLKTTRSLYWLLHRVGDTLLARTYVVQDYIAPSPAAALAFIGEAVMPLGIWPLWLCPVKPVFRGAGDAGLGFPYPTPGVAPGAAPWVNVGVYGPPHGGRVFFDPLVVNGGLEAAAERLGARKMLYAQSFYESAEAFWRSVGGEPARKEHAALRQRYGGEGVFAGLESKVLLGPARLARMRGVVESRLGIFAAWRDILVWYARGALEIVAPRALHPALGIHHTGMVEMGRRE
jgi:delta24-sterol reductase